MSAVRELVFAEPFVFSAFCSQFLVSAAFRDSALADYGDVVGVPDRGEPVRDHYRRAAF